MPWFMPDWSESIKKRLCRYLLQRYLGQFLEEKLTLDQLTIDLYNGKGIVTNVSLDALALNELAEQQCMPVWFVGGTVDTISVSIPWSSLLSDSSYVEVSGLHLTVRPKQRAENCTSMLESMWNSLSSSMQLAEECLKQEAEQDPGTPLEGLELFAQTIDSILSRVKVRFVDTVLRVEHIPRENPVGVALEVRVKDMTYLDEAGLDAPDPSQDSSHFQLSAFTTKKFSLEGVSLYTDEFEIEEDGRHTLVLAAKLAARQEARLKLKLSENIQGPKVSLELLLGSLTCFLSPRQLHALIALASELVSPATEEGEEPLGRRGRQKPMVARDFQLVEQDLQQRLHPSLEQPTLHQPNQGWSAGGGSDEEEQFLPMSAKNRGMTSSVASSMGGSMASSMTASTASSVSSFAHRCLAAGMPDTTNSKKKRSLRVAEEEMWSADTTCFNVRVSSLTIILLQEDILVSSGDFGSTKCPTLASTQQMIDASALFFANLGEFAITGFGVKDFEQARQIFRSACTKSHLRLLAAPIMIEGTERTGSSGSVTEGKVTAARLEVVEILPDQPGQDSELLTFLSQEAGAFNAVPDLQLSFLHSNRTCSVRQSSSTISSKPRTQITLRLQKCLVEVDLSLMDRIHALVNPQLLWQPIPIRSMSQQRCFYQAVQPSASSESCVDLRFLSTELHIKLRFPCPDLRPLSDMSRVPYWKRSVHSDWLLLEMKEVTVLCNIDSRNPATRVELTCQEAALSFQDGEQTVPLLHSTTEEPGQSLPHGGEGFGLARFVLVVSPIAAPSELESEILEDEAPSLGQSSLHTLEKEARACEPSPFSAKRVVHESDTPHEMQGDTEELVIPGDKREISEFIEFASRQSRIHVDVCLPHASLCMPSKHLYELVYNRITTDLMLWEPGRPSDTPIQDTSLANLNLGDVSLGPAAFSMCKSGIQLDSDSDSSSDSDGIFYSVHENRQRHRIQHLKKHRPPSGQSHVTVSLNITQGNITFRAPVRDSGGSVIPNQRGELRLSLGDGSLFAVSGHRGNPDLGYVCIQANQASLYHLGLIPAGLEDPALLPTIVQTNSGANLKPSELVGCGGSSLDMLTVAVKIHLDQASALKMVRVAAGVRGGTLSHRVVPGPQSWLLQLLDMLDVLDFPVPGYIPPKVITELHLHLWNCAVDYRPIHLPLRSMLTLGSFSISSNLAAQTRSSSLRFIAEDGALFISDRTRPGAVELKRDYVCVLQLGLFELSLRLSDDPRAPKVDLRASSTALHMRTCADSCRAFAELLNYFASDGDLQTNTQPSSASSSHQGSLDHSAGQTTVPQSHAEHVYNLMEEAMQDAGNGHHSSSQKKSSEDLSLDTHAEEFCFPDDGTKPVTPIQPSGASDDDEEFCILGEDPGTGIIPVSGEPEVRRLGSGPVRVVENHFAVPLGRTDPLQAPRHFPSPQLQYTLCDLALVWHLYGGSDFSPNTTAKHVRINSSETPDKVGGDRSQPATISFSKSSPHQVKIHPSSPSRRPSSASVNQMSWQDRGGPGRDHDTLMELQLNKVRFRHEEYAEDAGVASRQVLLIQSLEIRDRLASSAINKFLYLHCSESQPKQANANMVLLKTVHTRPDVTLPNQQECCLRVSLLPLRLNIDQDALLFLYTFFSELGASTAQTDETEEIRLTHQAPVMSVKGVGTDSAPPSPHKKLDTPEPDSLLPPLQVEGSADELRSSPPIFFRTLLFSPDVPVRVDYQGKRVDMTHGPLAGLLMGLAQLNCSELRLKRLSYRHGLLGFDKLLSFMMSEWLSDIKKNQLPSVLGGVGPMHSFVQLFQGMRDLVLLPIEQYQRDGRIVRGLQRGAQSFTSSTAMAALELTNRLVHAVQITAETAYDMLSPGPSVRQRRLLGSGATKRRRTRAQPADIREGVTNAYHLVQEGIGETARNIVAVASAEHEEKGMYGAVGGVLRQIPPTVVTPILLGAEAASSVLGGVRSQLAPDVRREAAQKWRTDH